MERYEKLKILKKNIKNMGSIAVAFSGGVDSTFLIKVAYDVLSEKVLAITAHASTFPEREFKEADKFVKDLGIKHVVVVIEEHDVDEFRDNPIDRCYYCKKEIFTKIWGAAKENNMKYVADGTNLDDINDYRPGMTAIKELKVVSPLMEAGFTKEDIRNLSKEMGLTTWDKPAFACLASRIPYGQEITKKKLYMIEKAEQYLMDLGFRQVRVRHHGEIARIEVPPGEVSKFFDSGLINRVYTQLKEYQFSYVTLDLGGYRTGNMNEGINRRYNRGDTVR